MDNNNMATICSLEWFRSNQKFVFNKFFQNSYWLEKLKIIIVTLINEFCCYQLTGTSFGPTICPWLSGGSELVS